MKIKKHLYKYRTKRGYSHYTIQCCGIIVANRSIYDEILEVYDECEYVRWKTNALLKIKEKYNSKNCRKKMKYIYRNQAGMYFIQRKNKHYASSWNLDEIIKFRDILVEANWDEKALGYKKRNKRSEGLPKYIRKSENDTYTIIHKQACYGTFSNLKVAIEERDLLMKHNWDYNFIDLY